MVEWTDFCEPTARKASGFQTWSWASSGAQFGIAFPSLDESLIQCLNPKAFVSATVLNSFKDELERIFHLTGPLISLDVTLSESSGQQYQRLKKCRNEEWDVEIEAKYDAHDLQPSFPSRLCVFILGRHQDKLMEIILRQKSCFYERVGIAIMGIPTRLISGRAQKDEENIALRARFEEFNREVKLI